jgi:predicted nucleic acid-binding protein
VIDASVAVPWFVAEEYSGAAAVLLDPGYEKIAPELIFSDVTHGLLKRLRGGQLQRSDAERALVEMAALVTVRSAAHLSLEALDIALAHERSGYDALYLALALEEQCALVTGDRRTYNAVATALPNVVVWIEDVPPP